MRLRRVPFALQLRCSSSVQACSRIRCICVAMWPYRTQHPAVLSARFGSDSLVFTSDGF